MKKLIAVFFALVLTFSVAACGCNKKLTLSSECYTNEGEGRLEEIDYDELTTLMDENKTFVLYVYGAACTSCAKFTPIVTKYAQNNNLIIYKLEVSKLQGKDLYKHFTGTPDILLFKDGEFKLEFGANSENSKGVFSSEDGWKKWIESKIVIK